MTRITIPVAIIEVDEGGHTLWVQSPTGATVLRLKLSGAGRYRFTRGCQNTVSHVDIMVPTKSDVVICLADDAES